MRQKPKKGTFGLISARKARKKPTYSGIRAGSLNKIRERALAKKGAFKLPPYRKVSKKLRKRTVELFGEKDLVNLPYYKSLPQFTKFRRPLKQNESKNRFEVVHDIDLMTNPFLNANIPNANITTAPLFAPPSLVPLAD